MTDKVKLALAILALLAGLTGFYLLSEQAMVLRVLSVIAGLLFCGLLFWKTASGQEFQLFAGEAILEVRKVVWPSRKETIQTTAAVFGFVVLMAFILYLTDKTLEWVMYDIILGWKKS